MFSFFKPQIDLPVKVRFYKDLDGIRYLKRMPVKANNDEIVYLSTVKAPDNLEICSYVTDKKYNILGYHEYYINEDILDGDYMEVYPKHQRKGIGEILRLASIMMFKENNLKEMLLDSMSTAIPFHMKYRFKPEFPCYQQDKTQHLLQNIIYRTKEPSDFNKLAKKLSSELYLTKDENKYEKSLSKFITQYVIQNRRRWDDAGFLYNLSLKLDDKTIKANADFYNKLFKKHEIDYKI